MSVLTTSFAGPMNGSCLAKSTSASRKKRSLPTENTRHGQFQDVNDVNFGKRPSQNATKLLRNASATGVRARNVSLTEKQPESHLDPPRRLAHDASSRFISAVSADRVTRWTTAWIETASRVYWESCLLTSHGMIHTLPEARRAPPSQQLQREFGLRILQSGFGGF
jgi:hypothetical protein